MTLQHRIDGDGEHVVVLSGSLGSTLAMWELQVAPLTERYRVLRYDHPGHGESPVLDVRTVDGHVREVVALLDSLGVDRVSFCGLSLGGAVGMRLALVAPERLERLVLCSTSMRFATPDFWDERAARVREGGVEAIADTVVGRWFTPGFPDVPRYRAMLVSTPAEGYARACEAVRDWDARGSLGAVRAPTLVIAGAEDPSTPPADLEAIARELPDASLTVVPEARHLLNVERAGDFNRLVRGYLP